MSTDGAKFTTFFCVARGGPKLAALAAKKWSDYAGFGDVQFSARAKIGLTPSLPIFTIYPRLAMRDAAALRRMSFAPNGQVEVKANV